MLILDGDMFAGAAACSRRGGGVGDSVIRTGAAGVGAWVLLRVAFDVGLSAAVVREVFIEVEVGVVAELEDLEALVLGELVSVAVVDGVGAAVITGPGGSGAAPDP